MGGIIGDVTVGIVIAFCAFVGILILWPEKRSNRKRKNNKQVNDAVKKDNKTEETDNT